MAKSNNVPGGDKVFKRSATDKSGEAIGNSPLSEEAQELARKQDAGDDNPADKQVELSTQTANTPRGGYETPKEK